MKDDGAAPKAARDELELGLAAQAPRSWNTKNLGLRLAADAVSAASAAALVAPIIAIIDR